MSFPPRVRSSGQRLGAASLLLPMVLVGCQDRPLPVQPVEGPAAAASTVPATVRTPGGDLITGDAAAFAEALKEIGPDGEVLVWIKETGTARPAPEFFLELPSSGKETIALPAEAPGAQRRKNLGPSSVRGAAVEAVVRALGGAGAEPIRRMEALPVVAVRLPEQVRMAALQVLLRHPNVDYVSAVRAWPVELQASPVGTNPIDAKHVLHKIPQAWDLTRGSGVKVGVLDTGLAREVYSGSFHEDARNFGSYGIVPLGFVDDGCSSSTANIGNCTPFDDQGHGTQMVGLVAGNDNNVGYVGIAPMSTTYSMKIAWNTHIHGHCGDNPFYETSYCIENDDFVRAVDYAASRRLHVLSMSIVGDHSSDVYRALATAYNSYGVFLVASTGNTKGGSPQEPASYDVVMGIAGVDEGGGNLFSTAARDVSGYAGGATMVATCSGAYYCDSGSPALYGSTGGTSAAAANVAGVVALVRSYHPYETVSQIWNRLVSTAEGPNLVVNAYAAITNRSPFKLSISGPEFVQPSSTTTWTASVQGGVAPYSYAWYRDGILVGTGSTYTGYLEYGGMQLRVNATDAAGGTATTYLHVTTLDPCVGYGLC